LLEDGDTLREQSKVVASAAPSEFNRLDAVYVRGQRILHGDELADLLETIREGVRAAAHAFGTKTPSKSVLQALQDRALGVERRLASRERDLARKTYARGLLFGVAISVFVLLLIGWVAVIVMKIWIFVGEGGAFGGTGWVSIEVPQQQLDALRDLLVVIGGGAAGACLSVLLRLNHIENISVDAVHRSAALYRIALGWLFAGTLLALVKGGILAGVLKDPSDIVATSDLSGEAATQAVIVTSWFYWAGLGVLAGFNERWARSLITRGGPSVPPTQSEGAQNAGSMREATPNLETRPRSDQSSEAVD
jgi:hypothetical protein